MPNKDAWMRLNRLSHLLDDETWGRLARSIQWQDGDLELKLELTLKALGEKEKRDERQKR